MIKTIFILSQTYLHYASEEAFDRIRQNTKTILFTGW